MIARLQGPDHGWPRFTVSVSTASVKGPTFDSIALFHSGRASAPTHQGGTEKSKAPKACYVRPVGHRGVVLAAGAALAVPVGFHFTYRIFFSLAGLFLVSLISNATPFFGASYTLVATAELIALGFSIEAFALVVGITAVGAALGKLVIYGSAKAFKKQLSGNKNVQLLDRWLQHRRFLVAVFVAAVVPVLPIDDYIFIGAAGAKGKVYPMMVVTVAAKLVKSTVEIALEYFGILHIAFITRHLFGVSGFELSAVLSIVMVVLGIFVFKFDWGRFFGREPERRGA